MKKKKAQIKRERLGVLQTPAISIGKHVIKENQKVA
jgi:hypothetical protein